jgi:hypothetical protein
MTEAPPARMQSLLAAEFDRRGWEWDLAVGRDIVCEVERRGKVDAERLAKHASPTYLARNSTDRSAIAEAIESALGGSVPAAPPRAVPTTLIVGGTHHTLTMEAGARISDSRFTVGGTQINIEADTSKQEVLAAVAALVRAGLADQWNAEAAGALAQAIDARDDIGFEDVQEVTGDVVSSEAPRQGRAKAFLAKVAAGGIGGALGTGISAAVGEVLTQLPI